MDASTAPAIGVSYQIDLQTGRQIVMQTHVPQDIHQSALDSLLDRMARSVERQRLHFENVTKKEALEKLLEQQERQHDSFLHDFTRLDEERVSREREHEASGRKGGYKAAPNEEAQRRNALVTLKKGQDDIEKTRKQIADLAAVIKAFNEA